MCDQRPTAMETMLSHTMLATSLAPCGLLSLQQQFVPVEDIYTLYNFNNYFYFLILSSTLSISE